MKNFALITFLVFIVDSCFAQEPNWSVNPNNYQHTMTFTNFLNVDGKTLTSKNDKVAAFIDGEVRGVANVIYVESRDKFVAFLTVFGNLSGKEISFKMYDSENEAIINIDKKVVFSIDGNLGSIFQSFSIANPALNNEAEIISFSFKDVVEKSINISEDKIDIVLPANTDSSNLIAEFTLSTGAKLYANRVLQEPGVTIQNYSDTFVLSVLSEDESVLKEFQINVVLENAISNVIVNLSTTASTLINKNLTEITLTISESIASINSNNFELTNAIIQSIIKVDENTYSLNLVALSQGEFSIKVLENTFLESDAKENIASNKLDFVLDTKNPFLVTIQRNLPQKTITNANNLEFKVVFSEAVSNVLNDSFISVTDAEITINKVTDSSYVVTVSNIENFNGQVGVSLNINNSITDIAGNSLRISSLKNY
ncbi:hypothetical protein [Polaribacter sp. Asnod6-C07]|uniref:hypothetical protein n=1 Tax=Polaribacter sp. Asnod6-C07 TaxID=3160582 RepID=UPI00386EFA90